MIARCTIGKPTPRATFLGLILIVSAIAGLGQTDPKKDESRPPVTGLLEINLLITDKANAFVGDIRKEELELIIDGKVQPIESVTLTTSPIIYVLAIDNSGSMRTIFDDVMSGAASVVGENKEKDLTALLRFVDKYTIQISPKFSNDAKYLRSQLEKFKIEGGQTALIDAIFVSVQTVGEQKSVGDEYRREVIVFSDGEDRASSSTEKQLIELLQTVNVRVSFVGLIDELDDGGGFMGKAPRDRAKAFIERITRQSGGVAVFPKRGSQLLLAPKQVASLLRSGYLVKARSDVSIVPTSRIELRLAKGSKRKDLKFHFRDRR